MRRGLLCDERGVECDYVCVTECARYWKPEKFRAVGVSSQRQQMRSAPPRRRQNHTALALHIRSYNHRERLRQENIQTIVAARADIHRNPPLKLDPNEFRVKKGPSKVRRTTPLPKCRSRELCFHAFMRRRLKNRWRLKRSAWKSRRRSRLVHSRAARLSLRLNSPQRGEIAQIAQAEIAKVQMMNKVTAKLEALAVKERERKKVEQC